MKKENLYSNNRKLKLYLFSIFIFCILSPVFSQGYDTDEVILFRKKAQEVINRLSNSEIPASRENIKDLDNRMKILDIINSFAEASENLEKKKFDEVRKILEKIITILDTIEYKKETLKITGKNFFAVSENRICVEAKIKNISEELIEDLKLKIVLKDDSDNIIREAVYPVSVSIIRKDQEIKERFYFYNLLRTDIVKSADIEIETSE